MEEYTLPIYDSFVHKTNGPMMLIDFGADKALCEKFIGEKDPFVGDMDKNVVLNGKAIRLKKFVSMRGMFDSHSHLRFSFIFEPTDDKE